MSTQTSILLDGSIWTADQASIWANVKRRNELRRSALLPLLDEQQEFENTCNAVIALRWRAFRATKQADHDRLKAEVVRDMGWPKSYFGAMGHSAELSRRFNAFLWTYHRDEITQLERIAPDYFALTREAAHGFAVQEQT